MTITALLPEHWPEVKNIYADGIATGLATFETTVPSWEYWDNNHSTNCRYVAIVDKQITGWAAISPVSHRSVYSGVQEVSIYISTQVWGQGIGKKLLSHLIHNCENHDIWMLQAVTFPENIASIKLHESCGFRKVGFREKIAKLDGLWRDTVLLERRSIQVS